MANKFRSDRERDPIAELARLIDQADSYGESAAADNHFHQGTEAASQQHDELPGFPQTPEQAHELYGYGHDDRAYVIDEEAYVADKEYQTEVPRPRLRGLALVMAIIGLALVGTAGAFGYRAMFRGSVLPTPPPIITASNEPNKIAPASNEPAENSANARQIDVVTTGSIEKLVSREEPPATIEPPKAVPRSSSRVGTPPCCGSVGTEPSDAACSGGRGCSRTSSQCRCVAARWPIGSFGRHSCSEPCAFGYRRRQHCGKRTSSYSRRLRCSGYLGAE